MIEPDPAEYAAIRDTSNYDAPVTKREQRRAAVSFAADAHRMLPASNDAELGVLASFLMAPLEVGAMCSEKGVESGWFHIPSNGTIYRIMMEFWDENRPLDVVQLTQTLRDRGRLDEVGGYAFITSLFSFLPTAANVGYYIEIVREKHALREMIRVGTRFASESYESQDEVWDLLEGFEQQVLSIRDDRNRKTIATSHDAVLEAMLMIQNSYENRGSISGLATGFPALDKLTDGLHGGEMIVIAARPSQGKTALAMNIAEFIAVELKKPIAVFSLEMSKAQLMQRMICSRAKVNLARVRDGYLADRDFPALTAAGNTLAKAQIFFDESSDLTIQELRGRARRLKNSHKIEAVFIDYLQLIRSHSKKSSDNRQVEVAEVSQGLKAMSRELGVPVVVLAQIGRDFERRGPLARPRLSDLRESGAIEQDADVVAFLVRAETYAETDEERRELSGQADLTIAKQRSGPVGDVALTFLKEFTRFESRAYNDGYGEEAAVSADKARQKALPFQIPD